MSDEESTVKPADPAKIPASIIMEQLGYSRAPRKEKRVKPRSVHAEVADNSGSNGAAIARFDGFFASVRSVKVQHRRNVAIVIEEQMKKARAAQRIEKKA